MGFIAKREKNFEKYLENHFGIVLPDRIEMFYAKGIRIGNKEIMKSDIHGELGYAACDEGFHPTNAMVQNFGHLATKNIVDVDEPKAKEFAVGRGLGGIDLGQKSKFVIVRYKGLTVGLGYYEAEKRKIRNDVPEKRRRKIINSL
jgi:NOL1/NOP2/fmu family ribosome biogenesis protein